MYTHFHFTTPYPYIWALLLRQRLRSVYYTTKNLTNRGQAQFAGKYLIIIIYYIHNMYCNSNYSIAFWRSCWCPEHYLWLTIKKSIKANIHYIWEFLHNFLKFLWLFLQQRNASAEIEKTCRNRVCDFWQRRQLNG